MERKRNSFIITLLLCLTVICSLLFVTCDGPYTEDEEEETGSFTINLGTAGRQSFPPNGITGVTGGSDPSTPHISDLKYKVTFKDVGSGGETDFEFFPGGDPTGRIAVGTYAVTMDVLYLNDNPYARGVAYNNPITIAATGNTPITVRVYDPNDALPPVITLQPVGGSYDFADTPILSVNAESLDGGTIGYQWFYNTSDINTGGTAASPPIPLPIATLTVNISTFTTMYRYYYVEITNTVTGKPPVTVTINTAQISVASAPVIVESTPSGGTMTARPFANLQAALDAITAAGTYIVRIRDPQLITPYFLSPGIGTIMNITLMAEPPASSVTVQFDGTGNLITIPDGVTLTLESGITLEGNASPHNGAVVRVNSGGELVMMDGSVITGNNATTPGISFAGGVTVVDGTFTMNGGEISNNRGRFGGGVFLQNSTFIMTGGKIAGNTSIGSAGPGSDGGAGGGVYAFDVVAFNKTSSISGGIIYGYSSSDSNSNEVRDADTDAIINNRGHAVNLSNTTPYFLSRRETTVTADQSLVWDITATPPQSGNWTD
ncbi:MAG: hypothetical protein FWH19_04005 [Treponema sp.]|nr:hypothetical protein [Treponema sp.]